MIKPAVKPPLSIIVLMVIYTVMTLFALWRATQLAAFDIVTLGGFPVLAGLLLQAKWAKVVLWIHLGLQSLIFAAIGTTAFIAYQITPEDVKVEFAGQIIPIWLVVSSAISLLAVQWWAGLSLKSQQFFNRSTTRTQA